MVDGPASSESLLFGLGVDTRGLLSPEDQQAVERLVERLPDAVGPLGLPAADRDALTRLLGRRRPGSPARRQTASADFTLAGVLRDGEDDGQRTQFVNDGEGEDVVIPAGAGVGLLGSLPRYREGGFKTVVLWVDREENVPGVSAADRAMGYNEFSLAEFAKRVAREIFLIRVATTSVAVVALLVAAMGLANTMG